ncbi:AMP-binding protein [Paraburkholderia sp. CNPSo 3157]|uniref:AMP-binding protein n=1 Tax=Paraburkholderia franconis TaxID=2654983 RepID=A0A7X1TK40_9BURK|nr:AMP-binding protein [Paraburkholderia franconis]MPW22332.1 AMP-binding protein [Paraburkholderia franconis]
MPLDPKDFPFRPVPFLPRDIDLQHQPDGSLIVRSRIPLKPSAPHIPSLLHRNARNRPTHPWLVQRRGADDEWQSLTYRDGLAQVQSATQFLLDLDRPGRTVMVLSENSLEHGVLEVAAMQAGMPYSPITTAYSLLSHDHEKLRAMVRLLEPAVIFAQSGTRYEKALRAIGGDAMIICADDPIDHPRVTTWSQVTGTVPTAAVQAAIDSLTPDTVAKYQFTSGSTGTPKAVIVTQGMLTTSLAMTTQMIQWEAGDTPEIVLLDWLPWSHVAGGHSVFNCILDEGGTLYIDDGRPTPAEFHRTLRNLRTISPSRFSGVPVAYAMLAEALQKDDLLGASLFRHLHRLTYSGARLPDAVHDAIQQQAVRHTGHRIPFVSAYGSTETSAAVTYVHWAAEQTGLIGLPHPGVDLKLIPLGDNARYEIRVRSPAVTRGYMKQPVLSREAFDEDGFLCMGDAAAFVDADRPEEGFRFAGRVAEEFKLQSGVFVRVSSLRVDCLNAAAPLLSDLVITGADRDYVGALAWLNVAACRDFLGHAGLDFAGLAAHPALRAALQNAFAAHNARHPGSSTRVRRLWLLEKPASLDQGETNDKGYINQRKVLEQRSDAVRSLYAAADHPNLVCID